MYVYMSGPIPHTRPKINMHAQMRKHIYAHVHEHVWCGGHRYLKLACAAFSARDDIYTIAIDIASIAIHVYAYI